MTHAYMMANKVPPIAQITTFPKEKNAKIIEKIKPHTEPARLTAEASAA
jgi:hypothetical protein